MTQVAASIDNYQAQCGAFKLTLPVFRLFTDSAVCLQRLNINPMAEETESEQLLHRLFEQVNEHIETRMEYFTLSSTEKMSGIAANLAGALVLMVFALLVLFFFSMGFAWWLGDFLGNRAGGFALAGLVFLPIAWATYRWVRPFVREKIIEAVLQNDAPKTADPNG